MPESAIEEKPCLLATAVSEKDNPQIIKVQRPNVDRLKLRSYAI